ncbi:MAG: isoaspartyl peptidase/L-asparaginase, partial [Luteitalea sp.]
AWLRWREGLSPDDAWGPSPHRTTRSANGQVSRAALTPEEVAFNEWVEDILRRRPTGTINCLAVDAKGDISGVTTTSGLAWKIPGRVGDSPILGAGLYVDGQVGAAGSTGRGEANLFGLCSYLVVEQLRQGKSPKDAGMEALRRIKANTIETRLLDDRGQPRFQVSFYVVNRAGQFAGVSLFEGDYAVCTANGPETRPTEALLPGKANW